MSRFAQALHVARKDVRFTRLALAVYSVVIAVALVRVLGLPQAKLPQPGFVADTLSITMFVLVLLGAILVASAVQSDSPVQSNAFWSSRPFDPTAMVGAKLLYAIVVLIGIPLLAELLAFMRFDTSAAAIGANLLKSATMYGLVLLCAAVVAALTTDLRGFIVAALILLIGSVLGAAALLDHPDRVLRDPARAVSLVVALTTGIGMLLFLYRRRDVGRGAWLGAVVVILATFVVFAAIDFTRLPVPSAKHSTKSASDFVPDADVEVLSTSALPNHVTRLGVRFTLANLPKRMRVNVQVDSAFLHLGDGSIVRSGRPFRYLTPNNALGALPAGIHRFGTTTDDPVAVTMDLGFDADSATIAAKGMNDIEVFTQVIVAEAVPLGSTRVGTPLQTTSNGTRLRISDDLASGGSVITMVASTVADARYPSDPRNIGLAVINERTSEGIVLTSSMYSNSTTSIILPGATVNTSLVLLNTNKPDADVTQTPAPLVAGMNPSMERAEARTNGRYPDPTWFHDAKVVAVGWIPRENYPLRVSKTLN